MNHKKSDENLWHEIHYQIIFARSQQERKIFGRAGNPRKITKIIGGNSRRE